MDHRSYDMHVGSQSYGNMYKSSGKLSPALFFDFTNFYLWYLL